MNPAEKGTGRVLVVAAHPDDETLWFSGVIARHRADVVCVTCGSDTPSQRRRRRELEEACALLGAGSVQVLDHLDLPGMRLDLARLERDLSPLDAHGYDAVYTHGPYGEVGENPHHQDVCCAVHRVFGSTWSCAWNQYPEQRIDLTEAEYALKKRILGTVYWKEYLHLKAAYPIGASEDFCKLGLETVERIRAAATTRSAYPKSGAILFEDPLRAERGRQATACHDMICDMLQPLAPHTLLGIGLHSQALTQRLAQTLGIAPATADTPESSARYDVMIAMTSGSDDALLAGAASTHLLLGQRLNRRVSLLQELLAPRYVLVERRLLPPAWEAPDSDAGAPLVYKDGVRLALFRRTG